MDRPTCSVFVALSLDGFLARSDGGLDWLDEANRTIPPGEDCGYRTFFSSVDALVMGRKTFETVRAFPAWPYGEKPVVVRSRNLRSLASGSPKTVSLSGESPSDLAGRLGEQGHRRLYVDGGETIRAFLAEDLIDDLTITWIPTVLGSGIPLFGAEPRDRRLECVSTRTYRFGFVQSVYRVVQGSRSAVALDRENPRERPWPSGS